MRIQYTGLDGRTRVAECNRLKFIPDGMKPTDNQQEYAGTSGPIIVAHVYRYKGGKRVIMQVPDGFDIDAARLHFLEKGWVDLAACPVKTETPY